MTTNPATSPSRWTASDMPNLAGRTAIVTGANSGIGLVTAQQLAAHGAEVTLAVRDADRGARAEAMIRSTVPAANVTVAPLDLSSLGSVRDFAATWSSDHPQGLDLLINNAGIMAIPRRVSADGYEMQLATNHLGHFALTGLLLPALVARPRSRVVTVSSGAHRMGRIDFDDLMGEQKYGAWRAYGQSKLANLLFTAELQRRLDLNAIPTLAMAAHPGYTATNLQSVGNRMRGRQWLDTPIRLVNGVIGQTPEMGALPTLFAATAPGLPGNTYVGPDSRGELRGHPRQVGRSDAAADLTAAQRLWSASEDLTGVRYPLDLP